MQDNASIHTYNKNKDQYSAYDLFERETIEVENWPSLSCDLNPLENCWWFLEDEKNREL
jgi:hypothetical protein